MILGLLGGWRLRPRPPAQEIQVAAHQSLAVRRRSRHRHRAALATTRAGRGYLRSDRAALVACTSQRPSDAPDCARLPRRPRSVGAVDPRRVPAGTGDRRDHTLPSAHPAPVVHSGPRRRWTTAIASPTHFACCEVSSARSLSHSSTRCRLPIDTDCHSLRCSNDCPSKLVSNGAATPTRRPESCRCGSRSLWWSARCRRSCSWPSSPCSSEPCRRCTSERPNRPPQNGDDSCEDSLYICTRGPSPSGDRGQATTEYALVLLGAAVIALLVVGWATSGGGAGKIGHLFDRVIDAITDKL